MDRNKQSFHFFFIFRTQNNLSLSRNENANNILDFPAADGAALATLLDRLRTQPAAAQVTARYHGRFLWW